jgi:hypothetical protein
LSAAAAAVCVAPFLGLLLVVRPARISSRDNASAARPPFTGACVTGCSSKSPSQLVLISRPGTPAPHCALQHPPAVEPSVKG